ncbi:hypothetical protein H4P1_00009 (plasmid) [Variovorax sp. PBS-H4]|nr:hypothetical protein [Variovorax sp. PBS-H4]VTU41377.1 hypothetical protein H4P1_00009 [Variovorax sp. PBS-H4]
MNPHPHAVIDQAMTAFDRHPVIAAALLLITTGLMLGAPVLAVVFA